MTALIEAGSTLINRRGERREVVEVYENGDVMVHGWGTYVALHHWIIEADELASKLRDGKLTIGQADSVEPAERKFIAGLAVKCGYDGQAARLFHWAAQGYADDGNDIGAAEMRDAAACHERAHVRKHSANQ